MDKIKGSPAHPGYSEVPVCGGKSKARIDKWTMAQRAELKPRLARLIEKVMNVQGGSMEQFALGDLFEGAEEEIVEICRVSVKLPGDLTFDDLLWEDLPTLAQGVWETNIITDGGGGVAGKLVSLVAPLLAAGMKSGQLQAIAKKVALSQLPKPKTPSSPDSPSSPEGGEATPSESATP